MWRVSSSKYGRQYTTNVTDSRYFIRKEVMIIAINFVCPPRATASVINNCGGVKCCSVSKNNIHELLTEVRVHGATIQVKSTDLSFIKRIFITS